MRASPTRSGGMWISPEAWALRASFVGAGRWEKLGLGPGLPLADSIDNGRRTESAVLEATLLVLSRQCLALRGNRWFADK
mmetsp:Transcript_38516/g.94752  ORF Transcript_38516/g.94752 Transcript_38516/m.94752 type:complete len:80 (-) Transcript_38516:30-269(-)